MNIIAGKRKKRAEGQKGERGELFEEPVEPIGTHLSSERTGSQTLSTKFKDLQVPLDESFLHFFF